MKTLAILVSLAALSGCATTYPGPANYGTRAYAPVAQSDPDGWQVVSVTPVPAGTGATDPNAGVVTSQPVVTNPGVAPVVAPSTVYVPTPVYADPYYYDPFWYPPISIGLGFGFTDVHGFRGHGRGFGRGFHGGIRGGFHGGGRR